MKFQRAAQIDDGIYRLPLTNIERSVYFYLSARCHTRWGVSEATMVAILRIDIKRIRDALETLEDMRMIKRWRLPRPKCHEYQVTLTTEDKWGIGSKRTHSIGSKRTPLMGANAPHDGEQTPLSPITKDTTDTALLAMGVAGVREWPFARTPMGARGIIRQKQQVMILEMMKALVGQGYHFISEIEENLSAVRDYLTTPKDTLSDDGRDYRSKTLGIWLNNWPDQLHRAQAFLTLRKQNIVKMPKETQL